MKNKIILVLITLVFLLAGNISFAQQAKRSSVKHTQLIWYSNSWPVHISGSGGTIILLNHAKKHTYIKQIYIPCSEICSDGATCGTGKPISFSLPKKRNTWWGRNKDYTKEITLGSGTILHF